MQTGNREFKHVGWTVGNHCNANCRQCYSRKARSDSRRFLTEPEVHRIVGQLVGLGVTAVNLGGNEPIFTHGPDHRKSLLPLIIRTLSDAGITVGFTTNGVTFQILDERYPRELALVNDIDFSLDHPFAREHDRNRGVALHSLVVQGIVRARELGIDSSVIVCGMRDNFDVDSLSAFLSLTRLLDCEFRINPLKPVDPSLVPEMPTAEEFYDGFAFLMRHTGCITLGESCLSAFTGAGAAGCPCGSSSFRINAKTKDGRVPICPCVYVQDYSVGDLLTEEAASIVSRPEFVFFAERQRRTPAACRETDCPYLGSCRGGCAARTYFVKGTLDARDPYCPLEYTERRGQPPDLPLRPPIGCDHGVRVHDNYLCTWIGKVKGTFYDARFGALECFAGPARRKSA